MTAEQAKKAVQNIPLGAKVQLVKKNGDIIEVKLASREVSGTEKKNYGDLVVPALPPALIVQGGTRFGNFRVEIEELVKIAWIE